MWNIWYKQLTRKNFNKGIVDPPKNNVVNKTIIRVVVIITCRVSSENPRCKESAYDIAPRNPILIKNKLFSDLINKRNKENFEKKLTTEPHYKCHFFGNFVFTKFIN